VTVNKVNNFKFEGKEVSLNGRSKMTYSVQKRRGINHRLGYRRNLKSLDGKAIPQSKATLKKMLDDKSKKTNFERDSDEDLNQEEV
jgi:hypothetical protein